MNVDNYSKWLLRQGYKLRRSSSSYFVEASPRVYQAFPYHWLISPSDDEITEFLLKEKAIALRYSTPVESKSGAISYHVILDDVEYSLETLPKKARYDVRKGLQAARIEPISFTRMADDGWQLRLETLQRQGREKAESQSWWRKLCQSAEGLPGFEAWAATVNNRLVASLIAFTCGETCSILYQQSSTEYLSLGVNNGLAFKFSRQVLLRPHVQRIFYGLHSLDAPPSVDRFKFRMGYTAKPMRQRVVFNPLIAPLFNSTTHAGLKAAYNIFPGNSTFAKAEGMLRFYLQGKRPLPEQDWPVVLLEQKDAILVQMNQS